MPLPAVGVGIGILKSAGAKKILSKGIAVAGGIIRNKRARRAAKVAVGAVGAGAAMEAGAGAVRGRGREAAEGTKRRRMNALNPKALGKATRRVMAFGAIAKRQLKQIEKMARKVQPAQRGRRTGGGCKSKCR